MLPRQPLKISNLHFHPHPPFHRHFTPLCMRICHAEKLLPLSSTPPKTITPSSGSHPIHNQKTCRKQGECCQHWAMYL